MTIPFDDRRSLAILNTADAAFAFAADLFFRYGREAIDLRGEFRVAVPGGSTPKKLFELFQKRREELDWKKVYLFFTDERVVGLESPESNYRLAFETFFSTVSPKENLFPMVLSEDPVKEAIRYEKALKSPLDLILLGMGEDGHIASLFPETFALRVMDRRVSENFVADKGIWRVTLTYKAIDEARHTALLALGEKKAPMISRVFSKPDDFSTIPAQRVGTVEHPALWILDKMAASKLANIDRI